MTDQKSWHSREILPGGGRPLSGQGVHSLLIQISSTAGLIYAISVMSAGSFTPADLILLVIMSSVTGLGITVGYHRYLAHQSFATGRVTGLLLIIAGAMAGQGPPVYWVALHRRHHQHSDKDGDPHSPRITPGRSRLTALWHSWLGWTFTAPVPNSAHYCRDLLRDPMLMAVNRHNLKILLAGIFLLPAGILLAGGDAAAAIHALVFGGLFRIWLTNNVILMTITTAAHVLGTRRFRTGDDSRNISLLAPFTLGESLHNNHHAFPRAAIFQARWWEIDPGGLFIRLLGSLRLAKSYRSVRDSS